MSDTTQTPVPWMKRKVFLDVLAAILIGFVGLAILEASTSSVILGRVLDVDSRLPVSLVVYLGSLLFGIALFLIDRSYSYSYWYRSVPGEVERPVLRSYGWIVSLATLALVTLVIWHSFGSPIDRKITDFFHEGEILAGFTILQHEADTPILIHGPGRNLLPGALALRFAEAGQEIAFMRFVTGIGAMTTLLMVAVAAYVFAFALLKDVSSGSRRHAISAIACLFATLVAFNLAHITNRHVLFLLALALAAAIIHAADKKNRWVLPLSAGFGAVCALAPIYVYATGLMTLALAVIVASILLFRHGRYAWRLLVFGGAFFAACIIVISLLNGGGLYSNAIRDISWWALEAGGIWSKPITGFKAISQTFVLIGVIASLGYLALYLARSDDSLDRERAALFSLLAFAVAIAARDMLDRSDGAHTGFSMLTVAIGVGALSAPLLAKIWLLHWKLGIRSIVVLASIGVVLVLSAGGPRQIYWGVVSSLFNGAPEFGKLRTADSDILPSEIAAVSEWYRSDIAKGDCLLVLTNEGVLNYAVSLPPCGDFFYPIYASVQSGDRRLADWLSVNPPFVAVVETNLWSDNIDGKPMKSRLPRVWEVIEEEMSSEIEIEGRVFAVRQ